MVVGAQQEKVRHRVAVVPVQRADLHLIQRSRYGGHGVLAQRQPQQTGELLALHLRVAQQLHELIQHIAEDAPQLGVFLRRLYLPLLPQLLFPLLQHLRRTGAFRKSVKHFRLTHGGFACFQPLTQGQEQLPRLAAHLIDLRQLLTALVGHLAAVALRVGCPVLVPQPHAAPDLPPDHIVFQQVALFRRQRCHAGLETAEHVLVLKAACHRVHGAQQQRQHRLLQNVAAAADVGRYPVPAEHRLQKRAVDLHIPRRHRHIPPADAALRQTAQLRRHILHLGIGRMRLIERDGRRIALPRLVRTEEVALQVSERRIVTADKVYHFTLAAVLLCHALQAPPLLHAVAEQLRVAVVPQQRHRHAVRLPQHPGDDVLLHTVEVGEPVDVHILARQIAGLRQRVAQLLHP